VRPEEASSSIQASEDCPDHLRLQLDKYIKTILSISTNVRMSPPVKSFVWMRNEAHDRYKEYMMTQKLAEELAHNDGVELGAPVASGITWEAPPELMDESAVPCKELGVVFKRIPPRAPGTESGIQYRRNRLSHKPSVDLAHLFDNPC
jgi:hypothetical protein